MGIGSRKEDLEMQSSTSSIISAAFTGANTDSVVEDANSHAGDVGKESVSRSARMSAIFRLKKWPNSVARSPGDEWRGSVNPFLPVTHRSKRENRDILSKPHSAIFLKRRFGSRDETSKGAPIMEKILPVHSQSTSPPYTFELSA